MSETVLTAVCKRREHAYKRDSSSYPNWVKVSTCSSVGLSSLTMEWLV